mmetsp:Transcript_14200/g.59829  ORF Transcript_14200/g.59829 Transcript_14200/m.59829 type:complete len:287 (-) Transcript_14200:285-1145(-)
MLMRRLRSHLRESFFTGARLLAEDEHDGERDHGDAAVEFLRDGRPDRGQELVGVGGVFVGEALVDGHLVERDGGARRGDGERADERRGEDAAGGEHLAGDGVAGGLGAHGGDEAHHRGAAVDDLRALLEAGDLVGRQREVHAADGHGVGARDGVGEVRLDDRRLVDARGEHLAELVLHGDHVVRGDGDGVHLAVDVAGGLAVEVVLDVGAGDVHRLVARAIGVRGDAHHRGAGRAGGDRARLDGHAQGDAGGEHGGHVVEVGEGEVCGAMPAPPRSPTLYLVSRRV